MKSYIAHVSSRRLFRALNIESNLARPVIIQIPTQSPGRYIAVIEAHQAIFHSKQIRLMCQVLTHCGFLGSRRMETAPTSIEVLSRPSLGQSDEPSDLRGSLSPTTRHRCTHVLVYTTPLVGALKSIYEMKCALLDKIVNFGPQIVEIFLYRNFNGTSWYVQFLVAILVFKMAATWDLYSAIFRKGRHLDSS